MTYSHFTLCNEGALNWQRVCVTNKLKIKLKDVYGDSVDKIVQGNTSNIVFLKSTDDTMIETLSKMSGVRHKTYTDSKTITRDMQAIIKMTQNEAKTSYTMTTKEEPVISYNDMAFSATCFLLKR